MIPVSEIINRTKIALSRWIIQREKIPILEQSNSFFPGSFERKELV